MKKQNVTHGTLYLMAAQTVFIALSNGIRRTRLPAGSFRIRHLCHHGVMFNGNGYPVKTGILQAISKYLGYCDGNACQVRTGVARLGICTCGKLQENII